MTGIDGRRIATADGAMLALEAEFAGCASAAVEVVFEPSHWRKAGKIEPAARGRGAAWFVRDGPRDWVLRHFRRGGLLARLCADRYLWTGEGRVRAFAEWRLLAALGARGLPVPLPIAARYRRRFLTYRCDLITRRIPDAHPLSAMLASAPLPDSEWRAIGAAVARLHRAGVDHADLNAHNILLDRRGAVSVIDFDRGRVRADGPWRRRNLRRLRRSLVKITAGRFAAAAWDALMAGYGAGDQASAAAESARGGSA